VAYLITLPLKYKCKCDELKHSHTNQTSVFKGENENVYEVSYIVNYHIAYCNEAYMSAKYLIIPCVEDVLGDTHYKVMKKVPLSNSTFVRRIKDINYNIKCELRKVIKNSQGFVRQVDEFTDITSLSVFFGLVRYTVEEQIEEQIHTGKPLLTHTT
jgi:hypothetical protein